MGYLRKETDSSLLYTVVNQLDPDTEGLIKIAFSVLRTALDDYNLLYLVMITNLLHFCRRGDP